MVVIIGTPTAPTAEDQQQCHQPTDTTTLGTLPTVHQDTTTVWDPLHWLNNIFFMQPSSMTVSTAVSLGSYTTDSKTYVITFQSQPQLLAFDPDSTNSLLLTQILLCHKKSLQQP
jgi:hypothetical protein